MIKFYSCTYSIWTFLPKSSGKYYCNCLLNIGLHGIGCLRQHSTDPFFEQILSRCAGLGDVRKLIEKNSDRNTNLLKECYRPCIHLISETFSRPKLKDEQFKVYEPSTHKEINKLFNVGLDKTLKPNDKMTKFSQRPELAQYLSHCTRVSKEVRQPRLYYL